MHDIQRSECLRSFIRLKNWFPDLVRWARYGNPRPVWRSLLDDGVQLPPVVGWVTSAGRSLVIQMPI